MLAVVLPLTICYSGAPLAVAVAAYSPTGTQPKRPSDGGPADHNGGSARGYQEVSRTVGNPGYSQTGRRPGRMFMHRARLV
jgi:hypothetical protein